MAPMAQSGTAGPRHRLALGTDDLGTATKAGEAGGEKAGRIQAGRGIQGNLAAKRRAVDGDLPLNLIKKGLYSSYTLP